MPRFRYEALTTTGTVVTNTQEASSKAELVSKLKVMGYWPTSIVEDSADAQDRKGIQIHSCRLELSQQRWSFSPIRWRH